MSGPATETVDRLDPSSFSRPPHLKRGDAIAGRYEILRVLGSGGSAIVYAVRDLVLGGEIALKVLRPDKATEINVERSRREAAIARNSSSPRLVRTFDLQESDGLVVLPMELVAGGSLREMLRDRGSLPIGEVVEIAQQILEALVELHALSIIHRDLKPANLLLSADGVVKISDFGLARKWSEEQSRLTSTGIPLGTLDYMSPEQAVGADVDARSDLYSFGVILFELLTGRVPFQSSSAISAVVLRLKDRPPDVRTIRPETPAWLAEIVDRLLEADREKRYPSAQAVLDDLRSRRARRRRRWLRRLPLVLIPMAVAAWLAFRAQDVPRLVADGDWGMRAIGRNGQVLWATRNAHPLNVAVVRRSRWARPEMVTVLMPDWSRTPDTVFILSFLDPATGQVLRTRNMPSAAHSFPYSPAFGVAQVVATDLDRNGANEVLVTYTHAYWPSFTVLHDLGSDESRILFVASGHHHVRATQDLDGDGRDEVLLTGIVNRMGWYTGIAAVRFRGDESLRDFVAATPDRPIHRRENGLLWYALAPPGPVGSTERLKIDRERSLITLFYTNGKQFDVDYGGFASRSLLPPARRQAARMYAYELLRAAERPSKGGSLDLAVRSAASAVAAAHEAGDARLIEWSERVHARLLVQAGRIEEAQRAFTAVFERSPDAKGDVAWDAAESMHLAGDLPSALEWYRTGMRHRADEPYSGRLLYEYVEGVILTLGEMGRWTEALEVADALAAGEHDVLALWFRRYVLWRSGGLVEQTELDVGDFDITRYWNLEMALATGADPAKLLPAIEAEYARKSSNVSLVLSTRSEALRRLGRTSEALALAREAYRRVRSERRTSTESRAHFPLVAERLRALAPPAEAAMIARELRGGAQLE